MQSENRELFQAKWGERRRHTSFTCETQDSVEKPPNQELMLNGHWARNRKHRGPREAATQQLIFILKQELPCDSNLRAMCGSYLGIYLEIPYEWMNEWWGMSFITKTIFHNYQSCLRLQLQYCAVNMFETQKVILLCTPIITHHTETWKSFRMKNQHKK